MQFFENPTDADLDMAVHADPSTDPAVWQQGAQNIEEYFGAGGTFWSEPITPNGEYISEGSASMSISSGPEAEAGNGNGNGIGIGIGIGSGSGSGNNNGIGTTINNNISSNFGTSSIIGGAMNGLNIDYRSGRPSGHTTTIDENYFPHRFSAPQSGFDQQQYPISNHNTTYNSSPPTTQQNKHGPRKRPSPTVDIKRPTQREKMNAELSVPVTPQLATPYVRGRTSRSTKGAKEMRREMEQREPADTPMKCPPANLKRKKKNSGEAPVGPRKQPKRAAKDNKKK
jgi:hypothetical protein